MRKVPKPILTVAGRPFLLHQLELLSRYGITAVVVSVGYLGEQIVQVIGTERYGISIAYSFDSPALDGTLGAVKRAAHLLGPRFLVLYGDTYLRVDYAAAVASWTASAMPAMMAVLRNEGRWDRSNADFDGTLVVAHDKFHPTRTMRWIDYGLGGLTDEALALAKPGEDDLASLYSTLASAHRLFGFEATERFYEIGTPAALKETEAFLATRE